MGAEKTIPARFRYVITRKDHPCTGCDRILPKRSRVLAVSGRVMGSWFGEYWCEECDLDRINSIPGGRLRAQLLTERRMGRPLR